MCSSDNILLSVSRVVTYSRVDGVIDVYVPWASA
jgi:hypothetical protein